MTIEDLRQLLNEWDRLKEEGESYEVLIWTPIGLFKLDETRPVYRVEEYNSLVIRTGKLYE